MKAIERERETGRSSQRSPPDQHPFFTLISWHVRLWLCSATLRPRRGWLLGSCSWCPLGRATSVDMMAEGGGDGVLISLLHFSSPFSSSPSLWRASGSRRRLRCKDAASSLFKLQACGEIDFKSPGVKKELPKRSFHSDLRAAVQSKQDKPAEVTCSSRSEKEFRKENVCDYISTGQDAQNFSSHLLCNQDFFFFLAFHDFLFKWMPRNRFPEGACTLNMSFSFL